MTRTLLATVVLALAADLLGSEVGIATMALAMDALTNFLADQILSAPPARDGDTIGDVTLALLIARGDASLGSDLLLALVLRLLERVSGALLAPLVTALEAGLVGTVGRLALVAAAMDAHADVLLDTVRLGRRGKGQVSRLDVEAVLLEQGLSTLSGAHDGRRGGGVLGRAVRLVGGLVGGLLGEPGGSGAVKSC